MALPGEPNVSFASSLLPFGEGLGFAGDFAAALELLPLGVGLLGDLLGVALGAGDLARAGDLDARFFGGGAEEVDGSTAAAGAAAAGSAVAGSAAAAGAGFANPNLETRNMRRMAPSVKPIGTAISWS